MASVKHRKQAKVKKPRIFQQRGGLRAPDRSDGAAEQVGDVVHALHGGEPQVREGADRGHYFFT